MSDADDDAPGALADYRDLLAQRPDPRQAVAAMEAAARLNPHKRRGLQAMLIARAFKDAAETAAACGWAGKVVISGGQVMVDQDGALFFAETTNRYFRADGAPQGAHILAQLRALGLEPRTILDVGANIGELSIYFARQCPGARILAFEPAPENLEQFHANVALQQPPLTNLELVREAVSDRTGQIRFTVGGGDLNTTIVEANLDRLKKSRDVHVVEVPTDTLENLCARFGVGEIDLLKLDTEGGEPLLAGSIRAMPGRIRSAYVEVSRFNTLDAYADLVDAFRSAGLVMAEKNRRRIIEPRAWLCDRLDRGNAVNVWFVDPARAAG